MSLKTSSFTIVSDVVALEMSLSLLRTTVESPFMDAVQIVADKAGIALQYQGKACSNQRLSIQTKNFMRFIRKLVNFIRRFWWRLRWGRSATLSAWTWSDGWSDPTFSIGFSPLQKEIISIENLSEKFLWESDYRFGFCLQSQMQERFWCLSGSDHVSLDGW